MDVEPPVAGPGEAVVEVAYAGLNFFDTLIIEGKYQLKPEPPFSPAGEFSGRVSALGPAGLCGRRPGDGLDRLRLRTRNGRDRGEPAGACSQRLAARQGGGTFHHLWHVAARARAAREMKSGETLVVLGASGGVGLAAVEIGRAMGARVVACASSDDKLEFARRYGAAETVNYATEDLRTRLKELTGGHGVNVVYDPVGGALTETALRSLAWKGRLLVIGFASGENCPPALT